MIENPGKFLFGVFLTYLIGGLSLVWSILTSAKLWLTLALIFSIAAGSSGFALGFALLLIWAIVRTCKRLLRDAERIQQYGPSPDELSEQGLDPMQAHEIYFNSRNA